MKKNIAVIAGGYSSEKEISVKSAKTIMANIPSDKYQAYLVLVDKNHWQVSIENTLYPIDKNDFSFTLNGNKITFACAYITIHGTPGEDGKLQGYFDLINLPYTSCNQTVSGITFNKWFNNQILLNNGVSCAKSLLLRDSNEAFNATAILEHVGLPCFVKPNDGGSSFGISKVNTKEELIPAINNAFSEGSEVVIEASVKGTEVTCGAYKYQNEIYALPITEIVSHKDYFDYQAKYEGLSDEITPARLSDELTHTVQALTKKIYRLMNLRGIIRIDYIIQDNQPFVIEINTAPGMTNESLIPQQTAKQEGLDLTTLLERVIEEVIG